MAMVLTRLVLLWRHTSPRVDVEGQALSSKTLTPLTYLMPALPKAIEWAEKASYSLWLAV